MKKYILLALMITAALFIIGCQEKVICPDGTIVSDSSDCEAVEKDTIVEKPEKTEVEEKVKKHTAQDDTGSIGRKKKDFYAEFREGVDNIAFPNKENKDNQ